MKTICITIEQLCGIFTPEENTSSYHYIYSFFSLLIPMFITFIPIGNWVLAV